jgi:NAD(P)H-dependent FMN reductase
MYLNILLVSSSQRDNSKSFDVAKYLQTNILNDMEGVNSSILDLSQYPFLLDHYGTGRNDLVSLAENKDKVLRQLYACDGVIFIVPEWGGMVPPTLVNLLLMSANGSANGLPLGHKPAFAIGVSASGGGSNPITLLKGYAAKNSHLTWLPLHAIIQNVSDFLAQTWAPALDNRYSQVQSRLLVGLKSLIIYSNQLASVREELVVLSKEHPFGQ